jgi:hypothetical protein
VPQVVAKAQGLTNQAAAMRSYKSIERSRKCWNEPRTGHSGGPVHLCCCSVSAGGQDSAHGSPGILSEIGSSWACGHHQTQAPGFLMGGSHTFSPGAPGGGAITHTRLWQNTKTTAFNAVSRCILP